MIPSSFFSNLPERSPSPLKRSRCPIAGVCGLESFEVPFHMAPWENIPTEQGIHNEKSLE
jgi:hypothetical protein